MATRLAVLLALALARVAVAKTEKNPDLDRALTQMGDLKYADAGKSLEAAWKHPGNDRDKVLQILELQGVVAATLNNPAKAKQSFTTLLQLDPEHRLAADYAPRVMTPYYEAKGYVNDHEKVDFAAGADQVSNGRVTAVAAAVNNDPTRLSRKVRFHLRADGGGWTDKLVPLEDGRAG